MATIQENIDRIKQAKADIKEAIIAKGVEVSDDVKIDGYADKISEIQQGGGGQFAVDFGEEIATGNQYFIGALQEDIDYYNEVVRSVESGERTQNDYISGELSSEFKNKIAWWPKGWAYPSSFSYYGNLKEFNDKSASVTQFRDCYNIKNISVKSLNAMGYLCTNNGVMEYFNAEDLTKVSLAYYAFSTCRLLRKFIASMPELATAQYMFNECSSIEEIRIPDSKIDNTTMFAYLCRNLKTLELGLNLKSNPTWQTFQCENLEDCLLWTWDAYNIDLSRLPKITPYSIHFTLNHTNSDTARILTLHATAKANWEASEYYEEDVARAQELNITIA